jgi:tRNA threonylcarbamoyladenosine biosynthesis protein TsaB
MSGLILETSSEKGALILSDKGKPIAAYRLPEGRQLSKSLANEVHSALKKHSFIPQFVAVGTGPGSYTGIRTGAALANALGYGWGIPVFGFCSLKAFVPMDSASFAVVVDARIGGLYLLSHEMQTPLLVSLIEAEKILTSIDTLLSPHPEIIKKRIASSRNWIETSPNEDSLSLLAYHLFLRGELSPLTLSYLSSP